MRNRRRREWELHEAAVTPEAVFQDRRALMRGLAAGTILAATSPLLPMFDHSSARAADPHATDPSAHLYPVARNPRYTATRALTDEKFVTAYNNFYEFGSHKNIRDAAQALKTRPWTVVLDGLVEKPMEIGIDDLLKAMPLEERVYRHRCVEAWSMVVPWSGFPMSALVDFAKPKAAANFVLMETFFDPEIAPGQKQAWYPWPYVEALTLEEARNELAFLVTGAYGKPTLPQNGAPLRLAVPWKYGFKSIKSITRFTFVATRKKSFWETILPAEYGFWANVNPEVAHPRWSQAKERVLGTLETTPTRLYNGYSEFVSALYDGLKGEKLFM
ncbi:protein-methionine-sulfoxide reductase catalytic subunit MsrP [Rhodospirillaceae bacterium AH-315-P19]|nr:protein-methionine-sulfoxide reductase catalytic subunit MsrP [Rhodospirillaceae bacterium AH-315-P19]